MSAIRARENYRALAGMLRTYRNPLDGFRRYLLGGGRYPVTLVLRTPLGRCGITVWTSHDILTVNEVFCRLDYPAAAETATVVDVGSNIGVSAAYFLTRNSRVFVYAVEPVPVNVGRLRVNLRPYEGRYSLTEAAVALESGRVAFGVEPTGRYGSVGDYWEDQIEVEAVALNRLLASVVEERGRIDILKIDVEGLEEALVRGIAPELRSRIDAVYAECPGEADWLPGWTMRQYGSVARWYRAEVPRRPVADRS